MTQFATPAEKERARQAVSSAIQSRRLVRPASCSRCPAPDPQAHHEDYTRPLDVVWLCVRCHKARHRELRNLGLAPAYRYTPPTRRMSVADAAALERLRADTAEWREQYALERVLRADRDIMIGRALAAGIPQRAIAEAVGVSPGRVGQIASAATP